MAGTVILSRVQRAWMLRHDQWQSQKEIAEELGLSVRMIQKYLNTTWLDEKGIHVVPSEDRHSFQVSRDVEGIPIESAGGNIKVLGSNLRIDTFDARKTIGQGMTRYQSLEWILELSFGLVAGRGGIGGDVEIILDSQIKQELQGVVFIPRGFRLSDEGEPIELKAGIPSRFEVKMPVNLVNPEDIELIGYLEELSTRLEDTKPYRVRWLTAMGKVSIHSPKSYASCKQ